MELKTNKENMFITLEVFYSKGGYSYSNYEYQERGYYASIKPEEILQHDGYSTRIYSAFTGYKILIEKASRLSKKKLQELNDNIKIDDYKHIIDIVAKENNLILV